MRAFPMFLGTLAVAATLGAQTPSSYDVLAMQRGAPEPSEILFKVQHPPPPAPAP